MLLGRIFHEHHNTFRANTNTYMCIQIQTQFFYKYTQCNRSNLSNLSFVLNVKSKTMCSREVVGGVRATAGGKEREREK